MRPAGAAELPAAARARHLLCDDRLWVALAAARAPRAGGTANDHIHISSVVITPDPPQKGKQLTVNATGTIGAQLPAVM